MPRSVNSTSVAFRHGVEIRKGCPRQPILGVIMGAMRKSRLSRYKQDRLIEHFVAGTTARTASSLCGVNRKTAAFYFHRLREIIAFELEAENEAMFGGEIEVDESYFGGKRKSKRGRGAAGKIPVFGLLKRGGKVYTKTYTTTSTVVDRK